MLSITTKARVIDELIEGMGSLDLKMKKRRDAAEETALAAMAAFEPLVRLFLDLGMSSPEAETLLRAVFVHQTHQWLSERDDTDDVSHSKVALLSGVHRNTVSEILSAKGGPKIGYSRAQWSQRAGRVLREWHFDHAYRDPQGEPRILPLRSPDSSQTTFWTLCGTYAPSIWPRTILDELVRVRAVKRRRDGMIEVLKSTYGGPNAKSAAIEEMGARARDLLSTLVHNLTAPNESQRVVETMVNVSVDSEFAKVLRRMVRQRAQALTASVESELNSEVAKTSRGPGSKRLRMGMTVFAFEGPGLQVSGDASSSKVRDRKKRGEKKPGQEQSP